MKHANIVWFEIPVKDLERAARFYSAVLGIHIERQVLLDREYGMMKRADTGIGGVLVQRENSAPGTGTTLFFYVNVISDAIEAALHYGGRVIQPKMLLKQQDKDGKKTIAQNLIDNQVGYYAELADPEGNHFSLYSHY
jgi:hypothetical protein